MIAKYLLCSTALLSLILSVPGVAQQTPAYLGKHDTTVADRQAIEQVLATYTKSVSDGDEKAFSALLLSDQIPFSSTQGMNLDGAHSSHVETRHYAAFRESVFESGIHYTQHFYNIHIEQDGVLAQASLDFVTQVTGSDKGGYGWKVLQLLKVGGQWKIASEFYTAHPLPH
jgi:ketosteroid isomerase-like protein